MTSQPLNDEERATYEWQIWVPEFGEEGQEKLKGASVMISRCGGLGGVVAYELAAAGTAAVGGMYATRTEWPSSTATAHTTSAPRSSRLATLRSSRFSLRSNQPAARATSASGRRWFHGSMPRATPVALKDFGVETPLKPGTGRGARW